MRILWIFLLALALAPAAAPSSTRTRVYLANESPLVVRGSGFRSGERVTVTVAHGKKIFRKQAVAGSMGGLVARWTTAMPTTCASTTVSAVGGLGSRAIFKIVANDCAPRQDPGDGPSPKGSSDPTPGTTPGIVPPGTTPGTVPPEANEPPPAFDDLPLYPIDPQPKQP